MIDEQLLEDLVQSLADGIDVPVDGPERILAAREARHPAAPRRHPLRSAARAFTGWAGGHPAVVAALTGALALVVVVSLVAGHGSGGAKSASETAGTSASGAATGAPAGATAGSSSGAGRVTAQGTSLTPAGAGGSPPPALPTKVVKTGSATVQVATGRLADAMAEMTGDAVGLSGFVASSTQTTSGSAAPSGDITLRVPVTGFETLVGDVKKLGTVSSLTMSGQDVTSQYVDLQARIQALQDTRTQFQQVLTRAQTIGDILAVEQQISTVQTQIDQLQGQLQVLDDQATDSTLAVHVTEKAKAGPAPAKPASGLSRAWAHARHSFAHGLEGVVAWSGGLALFLLIVAVLGGLARLAWVQARRRMI